MNDRFKVSHKGKNNPNSKKVICKNTGTVWGSVRECSDDSGIPYQQLSLMLRGRKPNVSGYSYQ
jgi:hypothetical protein